MIDRDSDSHYSYHQVVRFDAAGNRKVRDVCVPDEETRERHADMLQELYFANVYHPIEQQGHQVAPGGMPGATLLDNVLPHQDGRTFYTLDLKNAFPSVDIPTLQQKIDDALGPWRARSIQRFIDQYVVAPNVDGLPVGAPCSPYLFNVYCNQMDAQLTALCDVKGLTYTRWLDDITISSPLSDGVLGDGTRRVIREIIEETPGMAINHKKSKLHQRMTKPVTITGVSLYPDGRLQPSPAVVAAIVHAFDELEADIYNPDMVITDYHVARLNGYHGALIGMSREPYSPIMKELLDRYHILVRSAHAAIAMDQEPPYVPDPQRKKIVRSILKRMEIEEHRAATAERYRLLDERSDER